MKFVLYSLSFIYKLYVGIVFTLIAVLLHPIFLILLSKDKWKKKTFPFFVFWSRLLCFLCLVFPKRINKIHQLPDTPCMIVANHSSYFDIFIMHSFLSNKPFLFMGKGEILSYPLIKSYFKNLHIPVFRNDKLKSAKAFIKARKSIKEGWSIMVFPEGTIPDTNNPEMIPFKDGAFKMAKLEQLPIVSLTFLDNYHILNEPLQFGLAHPGISRVIFHPVISKEKVNELTEKELSELVFNQIATPLRERGLMNDLFL